ncbi:MAG: GntR family transcriptional regulator [Gammaproteobacteria bacterium]
MARATRKSTAIPLREPPRSPAPPAGEMESLGPIQRGKTLSEHAYDRIRQALMTGVLKPEQKVTVRAIASALNISITPARDALTRLINEGALEAVGSKTVIVPPLTPVVLDEITAIRVSLEGLAAEKAAAHFSRAEVDALETVQSRLIGAMDKQNFTEVLQHNEAFHFGVYRKSQMPRLVSVIEAMWLRVGPSLNLLYPTFAIERHGVSNHKAVLKALRQKDGAAARAAFENDIADGYQRLKVAVLAHTPRPPSNASVLS